MSQLTQNQRLALWVMLAIGIYYVPYLKWPFLWIETFFHEISHGIAAVLTGGKINSITLNYDGSGYCISQGGSRFITAFSGYFGSATSGMLIYLSVINSQKKKSKFFMAVLITLLLITAILWAKGISTYIILGILITFFGLFKKISSSVFLNYFLQFTSVFVVMDAIRSPLALIDGRDKGDGTALSELTFIPEILWVSVWFTLALACLFIMYRANINRSTNKKSFWA
jgi:hypothetical protein